MCSRDGILKLAYQGVLRVGYQKSGVWHMSSSVVDTRKRCLS